MQIAFIYTLSDPYSGEIRYVGKTRNPKQRRTNHLNSYRDKNTHKRNWINSIKKKGSFPALEILDEVPEVDWQYWEKYWIHQMKAWGFNLVNYGAGGEGLTRGNQTSFKKGNKAKSVIGYNKKYEKEYEFESAENATQHFNIHRSAIPSCCNNVTKTVKGIAWFYKNNLGSISEKDLKLLIDSRFDKTRVLNAGNFKKGGKGTRAKQIKVLDTYDATESVYHSGVAFSKIAGISQSCVSANIKSGKLIHKRYKIEFYENT